MYWNNLFYYNSIAVFSGSMSLNLHYKSSISKRIKRERIKYLRPTMMKLLFSFWNFDSKGLLYSSKHKALRPKFISVTQSCLTLCDPMDCFPVHHQLPELAQTHVHRVSDAIQPSHPLSTPSPALSLYQRQGLYQWVDSLHQVAKVLEFQLQHQSFQWIFRTDFL